MESLEICQLLRSQQVWWLTQHDFRSNLKHPGVEHPHRELCWGRWTSGRPCVEQTHWCCPDLNIWSTWILENLLPAKTDFTLLILLVLRSWVWDWDWDFWKWSWRFDWGFAGNSLESDEISKLYPALCRGLWISCGLQISWNHHAEFERYTWSAPAAVREAVREVVLSKRLWRDMERLETRALSAL